MNQAIEQLRAGVLLGDVVEALTGSDLEIHRTILDPVVLTDGSTRCAHTTSANSGSTQLGVARVTWIGSRDRYWTILQYRMREFLRANRVTATVISEKSGCLMRKLRVQDVQGTLEIEETIYMEGIQELVGDRL